MLAQVCSPALHALPDSSFPAASGSAEWHIWASSSCNFIISSPIQTILDALSSYNLPLSNETLTTAQLPCIQSLY